MDVLFVAVLLGLTVTFLTLALQQGRFAQRRQVLQRLDSVSGAIPFEAPAVRAPAAVLQRRRRLPWSRRPAQNAPSPVAVRLQRAALSWTPLQFAMLRLGTAAFLAMAAILLGWWIAALPLALVGYWLPSWYVGQRIGRRLKRIEGQLVEAVTLLSNALKAGFGFMQAIDSVAEQIGGPLALEFRQLLRDTALGMNPEQALLEMSSRIRSDDLDIVVTAVTVQRTVGGNLAGILDQVAETMREREKIRGEIRTLTSQQRMTGYILGLLPFGIGGLFYLINPVYMSPLLTTPGGQTMIGIALVMELIGALIIKRIVAIEV